MNYFIAVVMFIGLLMMVNIEKFKDHPTDPILHNNTEVEPIKTQEYSQKPQETSGNTTYEQPTDYEQPSGEIYKCKISNGKIVYSESPCPSNTVGSQIIIKPNVIDSSELRRQMANNKNQTVAITKTNNNPDDSADIMPPHTRDTRIRELDISINDETATYEKRADARNEIAYLKNKSPKSLSYELEQQRGNWKVGLTDFDRQKRIEALSALASIYTNYR